MANILRSEYLTAHDEDFISKTVVSLFRETAHVYPDKTAVISVGGELTYRQLDHFSGLFAAFLKKNGTKPGDIVGISMSQGLPALISILGIWKTGAAYMFLDTRLPEQRIPNCIKERKIFRIITEDLFYRQFETQACSLTPASDQSVPGGCAAVICASGSTDVPIGMVLTHKSIAASVAHFVKLGWRTDDRIGLFASFSYAASLNDFTASLCIGAGLYIVDPYIKCNMQKIVSFYNEYGISITSMPLNMSIKLMDCHVPSLRILNCRERTRWNSAQTAMLLQAAAGC